MELRECGKRDSRKFALGQGNFSLRQNIDCAKASLRQGKHPRWRNRSDPLARIQRTAEVKASGFGWQAQSRRCLIDGSAITICEAVVPSTRSATFGVLLAIFMAWPASAQDTTSAPAPNPGNPVKTGK